jgi:hypothetical protein
LAATSVDAMADAVKSGQSRAVAAVEQIRFRRTRVFVREYQGAISVAAIVIVLFGAFAIYSWTDGGQGTSARAPVPPPSAASARTLALMASARKTSETFLHRVGAAERSACTAVHGTENITTPSSSAPVSCSYLIAHDSRLLSSLVRSRLRTAHVLEAVGVTSGSSGEGVDEIGSGDVNAFVSLPYVPSLRGALNQLEITMTYHSGKWFVVRVTLA